MTKLKSAILFSILASSLLAGCASKATLQQRQYLKGQQAYLQRHYQQSVEYMVRLAEANDARAQYALGYMFYYGRGVPQDTLAAQNWIEEGTKQGLPKATIALHQFQQANYAPPPLDRGGEVTFSPIPLDVDQSTPPTATKNSATCSCPPNRSLFNPGTPPRPLPLPKNMKKSSEKVATISPTAIRKVSLLAVTELPTPMIKQPRQPLTQDNPQLLRLSPHDYTIQLVSVLNPSRLTQFIHEYQLQDKAFIYQTERNHRHWYVLVYGVYKSKAQARVARDTLPITLRQLQPWVKSVAQVQSELV